MSTSLHWSPIRSNSNDTGLQGRLADFLADRRRLGHADIAILQGIMAGLEPNDSQIKVLSELIEAIERYDEIEVFRQ